MNDSAEPRDDVLLERLAAGDEEAFRTLYRRHQRPLYRFALHMTGRAEAAEEVVQETFMFLIREHAKFDPQRGELAAFLFGVARNHVRRLAESDGRYQDLPPGDFEKLEAQSFGSRGAENPGPADSLLQAELTAHVRRAVLSLPHRYREVVILCDLEELEYERAAAILGCPVGTVRSRLNRAREMLAEKLRAAFAPKPAPRFSAARVFNARGCDEVR